MNLKYAAYVGLIAGSTLFSIAAYPFNFESNVNLGGCVNPSGSTCTTSDGFTISGFTGNPFIGPVSPAPLHVETFRGVNGLGVASGQPVNGNPDLPGEVEAGEFLTITPSSPRLLENIDFSRLFGPMSTGGLDVLESVRVLIVGASNPPPGLPFGVDAIGTLTVNADEMTATWTVAYSLGGLTTTQPAITLDPSVRVSPPTSTDDLGAGWYRVVDPYIGSFERLTIFLPNIGDDFALVGVNTIPEPSTALCLLSGVLFGSYPRLRAKMRLRTFQA